MVRTQIYLTEAEHRDLRSLARKSGSTLSELFRGAVDRMLETRDPDEQLTQLRKARGAWSERADIPDFSESRTEGDARLFSRRC